MKRQADFIRNTITSAEVAQCLESELRVEAGRGTVVFPASMFWARYKTASPFERRQVDWTDITLSINDFSKTYITPFCRALCARIPDCDLVLVNAESLDEPAANFQISVALFNLTPAAKKSADSDPAPASDA